MTSIKQFSFVFIGLCLIIQLIAAPCLGGGEKNPILGDWSVVAGTHRGKDVPKDLLQAMTISISENKVTKAATINGETRSDSKSCRFPAKGQIDFVERVTFDSDKEFKPYELVEPGIYELKGDELKMAFKELPPVRDRNTKVDRPTNFETGQGVVTLVLKRKAK